MKTKKRSCCSTGRCSRKNHPRGMAVIELVLALGLLFTTAWAFLDLGAAACKAFLYFISHLVLWPLL